MQNVIDFIHATQPAATIAGYGILVAALVILRWHANREVEFWAGHAIRLSGDLREAIDTGRYWGMVAIEHESELHGYRTATETVLAHQTTKLVNTPDDGARRRYEQAIAATDAALARLQETLQIPTNETAQVFDSKQMDAWRKHRASRKDNA